MHDRRTILSSGLALTALTATGAHAQNSQESRKSADGMALDECIDICRATERMCVETSRYCLEKGGAHASVAHLSILADCADLCDAAAMSLMRKSPIHAVLCDACARACKACSESCSSLAPDEQMRRCAAMCRDCAKCCQMMAMEHR